MSPLPLGKIQAMLDQLDNLHSKQETMKISEAMDNTYDQIYYKQHKLLIDFLSNELKLFYKYVIK